MHIQHRNIRDIREGNFYFQGTILKQFGHCFDFGAYKLVVQFKGLCKLVSVTKRTHDNW